MVPGSGGEHSHQRWTLGDIPYRHIYREAVAWDQELFYLVASASFIEITTDLYTRNLVDFFTGDAEVTEWLDRHWLHEELQHGAALKRYVQTAWPEFDWESAYRGFHAEYSRLCRPDELEPLRSLEMASRCVVEMGTASYYTTLSRLSPDPVLRLLTRYIKEDEVRHYKYFYRYFLKYREREHVGRTAVMRALWHRLRMFDGEDGLIAFRNVFTTTHPGEAFTQDVYRDLRKRCQHLASHHFPHDMTLKMLLKPLDLAPSIQNLALPVLQLVSRRLVA